MNKPTIKFPIIKCKKLSISLEGEYFFGESQRRIIGEWEISVKDDKIYFENNVELILGDKSVVLSPLFKKGCSFLINSDGINDSDNIYSGGIYIEQQEEYIYLINDVDIEFYIRSVLSCWFPNNKEIDFLKVQAVILRNNAIQFNKSKLTDNIEKFDAVLTQKQHTESLYDTSVSNIPMMYYGLPKVSNACVVEAVSDTKGMVLVNNDYLSEIQQSFCCGGVTEIKDSGSSNQFKRVFDSDLKSNIDLTQNQSFEHWIYHPVDSYCNIDDVGIYDQLFISNETENFMIYRWNKVFKKIELSSLLRNKFNINIGHLKEIEVVERGISGSVKWLRFIGSKGEVDLKNGGVKMFVDLLKFQSEAFIVDANMDNFTFNGAGSGEGVGLCQLGAMNMASKGKSMNEIFEHYFPDSYIEKQY